MEECRDCAWKNSNSVCEKYGHLVEDDDTCFPVFEVRCSWCGQRTTLKKLKPAEKTEGSRDHSDYEFFAGHAEL